MIKKETLPLCRERACGHRNNRISSSTMSRHVESESTTLPNCFSRYPHVGLTAMYPLSISSYKSHFPTRVAVSTIENLFMGFPSFSRLSDGSPIRIYIIHLLGKHCKCLMQIHQGFAHCPSLVVMMGIYTLGAMAAHPAYIRTVLGSSPRACTTWSCGVMVTQRFSQPLFRVQLPAVPCFF